MARYTVKMTMTYYSRFTFSYTELTDEQTESTKKIYFTEKENLCLKRRLKSYMKKSVNG